MKKRILAILLMCVMVVTLLPVMQTKAAGFSGLVNKKNPGVILTESKTTSIYVGGARVNLSYIIGGKTSGVKGIWSSSNPEIVKVSQKGSCKAVDNGIAYISFTYSENGEKQVLKCKLKSKTKATAVSLTPVASDYKGTIEVGGSVMFNAKLTTNPKALAVNPYVETTYGAYYELYTDAACKTKADSSVATVSANGMVTGLKEGTVYLRAVGKSTKTSTSGLVYSMALPITIKSPTAVKQTDSNKFAVTSNSDIVSVIVKNKATGAVVTSTMEAATNKKSATVTTSLSPLKGIYTVIVNGSESFDIVCTEAVPTRLELVSSNAVLNKLYADANGHPKASVYFSLYDQFGNDITTNPIYSTKSYIGVWNDSAGVSGGMMEIVEQGVATMDFANLNITAPVVGTTYTIKLIYAGASGVTLDAAVTLGNPSIVQEVAIKGIYTYVDAVTQYKQVASTDINNIISGTEIKAYANSMQTPGAYYLLVSAKDQYGNALVGSGIGQDRVALYMQGGTTNLALAATQSIGSVTLDDEKCLVYPLAAAKLTNGTASVVLSSGSAGMSQMQLTIAETAGIQRFDVRGQVNIQKTNNGYAPTETELTYTVLNTANNLVTNYDMLVQLTKATTYTGSNIAYLFDTNIIQSANGSMFWWEKQSDGTAKLYCNSVFIPTIVGTTVSEIGVDKITTLKGTANENSNNSILQYVVQ